MSLLFISCFFIHGPSMALHHSLFFLLLHVLGCSGGPLYRGYITPNYTVSHLLNVDHNGVFLNSPNSTFHASMCNPAKQQLRFYLCVVHKSTHTIVWSANVSSPVSSSGKLKLSSSGLTISAGDDDSDVVWSFSSDQTVSALHLHDSGNLVLVDQSNASLWESFDHPTHTFVSDQRIVSGAFLTSSVSDSDLMPGDYKMLVSESDVVLEWNNGQRYWTFSSDLETQNYIPAGTVSHMMMNGSGLFLFDRNSRVMRARSLPAARLRFGKIDKDGHFTITSYEMDSSSQDIHGSRFTAPTSTCDLPFACSTLGLCTPGKTAKCGCPPGFKYLSTKSNDCVPSDGSSLAASDNCNYSSIDFKQLPTSVRYFDSKFQSSGISNLNISSCRSFCSHKCTCLGFYYTDSSKSCSFLQKKLGSLIFDDDGNSDTSLYIKIVSGDLQEKSYVDSTNRAFLLPILLPSIALVLLVVVIGLLLFKCLRKESSPKYDSSFINKSRFGCRRKRDPDEDDDDDDDDIPILGLPTRFTYAKLEESTEGFSQRIGSGGFGEVFKGTLSDKTTVAVKRITNMGVQGKKEFCTEIAVIGKIHHVNLVKLRGFCAQGSRRLLVYEFMNRSSLDRSLFNVGGRPVLEWEERVQIAIGASRGLSYLHTSCDSTILHCDIKPENILLHDHNGVKIADFGLAKLLRPEESNFFTTMRGTRGYLAPEWLTNSAISDRTDVYSFGMVLLEIVHGRKNCVSIPDRTTLFAAANSGSTDGSPSFSRTLAASTMPVVEESYFPLLSISTVRASKSSSEVAQDPIGSMKFGLDNLGPQKGAKKKGKRKGRGIAAGQGNSCGFGMRGQKSRSGPGIMRGFEGGQTALYRRLPKLRGIAGGMRAGLPKYLPINIKDIESAGFQDGDEISLESLKEKRLINPSGRESRLPLKILGEGELTVKLNIKARAFSIAAKEKLEAAGCTLTTLPGRKKWRKPSVLKNITRAEEYFAKKRDASSESTAT